MDGIHDLGGMHGFGPVVVEPEEPVFHERWEGRVYALTGASGGAYTPNLDAFRHAIERLDPVTYLTAGYYGRWLLAVETRLVESGELEPGAVDRRAHELGAVAAPGERARAARSAPSPPPATPSAGAATAKDAPPAPPRDAAPAEERIRSRPATRYRREVERAPRFRAGDAVRARNLHPPGHTRLPRYARGRRGEVAAVYDAYVFPDANAHGRGEEPQHLYSVAFRGEELWGADAEPGTVVHLDLFESYLEPEAR